MKYKLLGNTDIEVPPIAFGGNVFGWTADEKMSFRLLDELFEKGFNFIDSANVYSTWAPGNQGGESEAIIGKWMSQRKNRDKMVIATKLGYLTKETKAVLSPANIKKQLEASLKRLQSDYVDVYFSHVFEKHTKIEDTLATYGALIKAGKVRSIGASNFPFEMFELSQKIAKENSLPRYEVYQPEYSLMTRKDFEAAYRDYAIENNIAIIGYFTLASGFLTGKYRSLDETKNTPRAYFLKKFFTDRGEAVLKALSTVSQKQGAPQAAIALAWAMAQPGITAPIASASKPAHLASFYQAINLDLDQEDLGMLTEASAESTTQKINEKN
ncbi:MAG TPA: alcohol dehydrogenase [Microscillaceae bacterium]|nr:alcohol dehydrogenase [Microscillaceae bacterium]